MSFSRSFTVALAIATAVLTGYGQQQSPSSSRSWPPTVQPAPASAPVLTPEQALATFSMPPGYRLELAASEPTIQDPIVIEWDARGRIWALELPGYMRDINAPGELDPVGRVVVLEDANDDGRFERRTVFADGLVQPRALKVLEDGALVGEPPNIWLLRDTDGDLRADRKDLVASGYGARDTNVEVNANGLLWAMDNRIYTAGTGADLYLAVSQGEFEARSSLARGQWGITQDDAGRVYRNHNESVLHADVVPTQYFARNTGLLRTRGSHEALVDPAGDVNEVWPARQTPGTNRAYQHGILRDDKTLAAFTAACAPAVYRGDRLPAELRGNVFVAEPAANLVSRLIVTDDGTALRARKAYERGEFLTSTDERFRPVYLSSAPDGTLYVVDMYRGIIQHRAYITEYLRDQILSRELEQPTGLGRIYRVVHETTVRDLDTSRTFRGSPGPAATDSSAVARAEPEHLVRLLSHPNGWWRDTAQQMLVQRGGTRAVHALVKLAEAATDWRTRLHALWTLDGIGAIDAALVRRALDDSSRDVRAAAVRMAERWLAVPGHEIHAAVLERADDPDWTVRAQAAASLGVLPAAAREAALASVLERHADDPIVVDAALSGLGGIGARVLERLLATATEATPARNAIAMTTATLVRAGEQHDVERVFSWAAESGRARWQREALLSGLEVALTGAPMPGSAQARRSRPAAAGPVPCPTCPGGRAGPGGAYAFPEARPATAGSGARGGRGGPALRLTAAPSALTDWAARGDEFRGRIEAVLARIAWPGKAGGVVIPSLTDAEQARFDAGRTVYQNICQACHQPDGRGQERIAPSLIGSPLALGDPAIAIRILLNGKEGPVGLMPPIGATLTDDQVAAALTYIRREWGQTGTPVEPDTVRSVRAATAGRTRPWTEVELAALGK